MVLDNADSLEMSPYMVEYLKSRTTEAKTSPTLPTFLGLRIITNPYLPKNIATVHDREGRLLQIINFSGKEYL